MSCNLRQSFPPSARLQRGHAVRCRATSATSSVETSVATLKEAAVSPKVPPKQVFLALRDVQKAKLPSDDWEPKLACGHYWRLVFTADAKALRANLKDENEGSGKYFPILAANQFTQEGKFVNGIYIPHVAALQFEGPYEWKKGMTPFTFDQIKFKLGPFNIGPFNINTSKEDGKKPFFKIMYVDDEILCALGRSGGIAMWSKADKAFELEKGLNL
eukprot:jgi/Ulvmu1/944/UM102_0027.1